MDPATAFAIFLALVALAFLLSRLSPRRGGADLDITAAVNAALAGEFLPGHVQIDVKTFDGGVILGGVVREFDQARRALEIAGAVAGVKSVENRMSIRSGH